MADAGKGRLLNADRGTASRRPISAAIVNESPFQAMDSAVAIAIAGTRNHGVPHRRRATTASDRRPRHR